ncbi:hypothetical protein ACA910_010119 [Epithemia clementina (nom. ined.)]
MKKQHKLRQSSLTQLALLATNNEPIFCSNVGIRESLEQAGVPGGGTSPIAMVTSFRTSRGGGGGHLDGS